MGFKSAKMGAPVRPQPQAFVREDKWKLASQLQKAIRHGQSDVAVQAARDLHGVEPAYLRYRLAVIAVEDVAAGSPEIVEDAFSGGWRKADVAARGDLPFLERVVAGFAAASKDRTPCDLMYATRFVADFEQLHGPWDALDFQSASCLALDPGNPWFVRALSAWRCAGTDKFKPRTNHLPVLAGDWDRWIEVNAEAFGPQAGTLMRIGENQREHHHLFIGLALSAQRHPTATVITPDIPQLPRIGYWLSAALDKHTSEGRKALARLPSMVPSGRHALRELGVSEQDQPDLIGRLWFWKEGSRCVQERDHPMSRAIRQDNQDRVLGSVPLSILEDAFGDPQLWQRARQLAVGHAPARPAP